MQPYIIFFLYFIKSIYRMSIFYYCLIEQKINFNKQFQQSGKY